MSEYWFAYLMGKTGMMFPEEPHEVWLNVLATIFVVGIIASMVGQVIFG